MLWKTGASDRGPALSPPGEAVLAPVKSLAPPPEASAATREEKRFDRYDRDDDGRVSREEFFRSRKTAFAKLDSNGDGRLTFDEWAIKTRQRFEKADADRSVMLDRNEFATTRISRKAIARCECPPQPQMDSDHE